MRLPGSKGNTVTYADAVCDVRQVMIKAFRCLTSSRNFTGGFVEYPIMMSEYLYLTRQCVAHQWYTETYGDDTFFDIFYGDLLKTYSEESGDECSVDFKVD